MHEKMWPNFWLVENIELIFYKINIFKNIKDTSRIINTSPQQSDECTLSRAWSINELHSSKYEVMLVSGRSRIWSVLYTSRSGNGFETP